MLEGDLRMSEDLGLVSARAADLFAAYQRTGQWESLEQAVVLVRRMVAALPVGHPERVGRLIDLSNGLRMLFERTGQLAAMSEAVQVYRQIVAATPADHRDRAARLGNLGVGLLMLFERTGETAMLEESVQTGRQALAATPANHPERAGLLAGVANGMTLLFAHTGQLAALTEAVQIYRQAVAVTPIDHPECAGQLSNLATGLSFLFTRTGQLAALTEAVQIYRQAVAATPSDHPEYAMYLSNLGSTLYRVFTRTGELPPLAEAVQISRQAVAATPTDHPGRAGRLTNLGLALCIMFERTGETAVLDEAVQTQRQAVAAIPVNHPDRATILGNLGNALLCLFERTGETTVLEEAVQIGRQVVAATPIGHPDHAGRLGSLGIELFRLFERNGETSALTEAVQTHRQAVAATPTDHPARAGRLSRLGSVLLKSFEHTGESAMLDEAVQTHRQAVAATPTDHPGHAIHLGNLGNGLLGLFERTGETALLDEAVQTHRQAAATTPTDHPERARRLAYLGNGLRVLFERTGKTETLAEAREYCREAGLCDTGESVVRINAYRWAAQLSVKAGDTQDGLWCVEAAVELIDALAPGSLVRADREHQVGQLANFPAEVVGVALAAGRPGQAVELLERTRGVLADDALGMRGSEPARLRESGHSALADRLDVLRTRLDALEGSGTAAFVGDGDADTARQAAQNGQLLAQQRRAVHAERAQLLAQIRALPGLADFLRTPAVEVLARRHARGGPVVFVAAGPTRSDALILTDTAQPVQVVPLPDLTRLAAIEQVARLLLACSTVGARDLEPEARQGTQRVILDVLAWLWDAITEPVLTALGHTTTPADGAQWPRVWWCPVGVLAFLPLHASGHNEEPAVPGKPVRSVPDLVVSSYTPTARALAQDKGDPPPDAVPSTLIVPVPDLPGAQLRGVGTETAAISALIPNARVLRSPTRASVLELLPDYRIAHFGCHGYADWAQPAASRLLLSDHATDPLTVADITSVRLRADLAYLSACSTTVTSPRMVDEALHITGAFHLAGYRQVIGTLWPVDDDAAAEISADFYAYLTQDGATYPRPEHAAVALHRAVGNLRRRRPDAPNLWAAHIHTGA